VKLWTLFVALFKLHKHLDRGETVWKMMSILVSQEESEVKSRFKKLAHANCSQMVDQVAAVAAGISHGTCHKILSDELKMSCYPAHCSTCSEAKDQCANHMSSYSDLTDSVDKDGTFLN
jgi:hypothetical protein